MMKQADVVRIPPVFDHNVVPRRLERFEHRSTHYILEPHSSIRPNDVVNPDYWVHLVERLGVNDRIEVIGPLFEVDLRVLRIDRSFLNPRPIFRVLRTWPEDIEIAEPELRKLEYKIENIGSTYRAVSLNGRTILTQEFPTEADAEAEMERLNARFNIAEREQQAALGATARRRRAGAAAA